MRDRGGVMEQQTAGVHSRRRAPRFPLSDSRELPLGQRIFAVRHASLVVLAIGVAAVPAVGPDRFRIAAAVLLVVLPWDLAMHAWSRRHDGHVPLAMPFVNQLI